LKEKNKQVFNILKEDKDGRPIKPLPISHCKKCGTLLNIAEGPAEFEAKTGDKILSVKVECPHTSLWDSIKGWPINAHTKKWFQYELDHRCIDGSKYWREYLR
jgi:hypothetical protein